MKQFDIYIGIKNKIPMYYVYTCIVNTEEEAWVKAYDAAYDIYCNYAEELGLPTSQDILNQNEDADLDDIFFIFDDTVDNHIEWDIVPVSKNNDNIEERFYL
jgi:hypothetical protein